MPRKSTIRLTQKFCDSVAIPATNSKLHRCSETTGLGLKVQPSGHKAFVFSYSAPDGRERRFTVGQLGAWKIGAARRRVEELRKLVDQGVDPSNEKKSAREAVSLNEYWGSYKSKFLIKRSEAYQRDFAASWERIILPHLGPHTKVKQLSQADIQDLLDRVTTRSGPVYANRCHSHLRVVLGRAEAEGLLTKNPAGKGISRNAEEPRERYLTKPEMKKMSAALRLRRGDASADAIALLLLTGARKTEVLSMQWRDIDWSAGFWDIPSQKTKQRRRSRKFLPKEGLDLLENRLVSMRDSEFVFTSSGKAGHLTEVRRTFATLLSECNITNCRLHDLRHSFASLLVSNGKSLETIGALLGHSQPHTTKRYAHLYDEELRDAAQVVADALD